MQNKQSIMQVDILCSKFRYLPENSQFCMVFGFVMLGLL